MRISEKSEQMKNEIFLINDQFVFWLDPLMKNTKNSKNVKHLILMNVQNNVFDAPCFT